MINVVSALTFAENSESKAGFSESDSISASKNGALGMRLTRCKRREKHHLFIFKV